jgi:glutamate racemase
VTGSSRGEAAPPPPPADPPSRPAPPAPATEAPAETEPRVEVAHAIRSTLPIGVFDSGVGGLTVLRALRAHLPREPLCYLGDTARLPYGTKSPETVRRYAIRAAHGLVDRGVKMLVVACNTASALALEALEREFASVPVVGVVRPGARAAAAASKTGRIGVLATESTARGGAYEREILAERPDAVVASRGCSVFVALAEEGWSHGPVAEAAAREYVGPLVKEHRPDCLLLGCTHFPVLADVIGEVAGAGVRIVDSAETTAAAVAHEILRRNLAVPEGIAPPPPRLMATDSPERFERVAARFLPPELVPHEIELVDL